MIAGVLATGQTLSVRSPEAKPEPEAAPPTVAPPPAMIPLQVPAGTPLKVVLADEVRIQKVGQPVRGKLTEPVYVFDKEVIPAGSEVTGKVAAIDGLSKSKRTMAALNADFSPTRQVHVEFDELVLPDGRHLPLQTVVSPGSQGVLQFVPAAAQNPSKTSEAKNAASKKVNEAKSEVKRQWDAAMTELHTPGKVHRLERYAEEQLPYRPQYMNAGTGFNADLQTPLDFGTEPVSKETLSSIGDQPPSGSVVHALLVTPLSSATSKKGDAVEAVVSQPLVVSDKLVLPQGSHLQGSVLQVQPARSMGRNGQLRIVFHQIIPPNEMQERVEASLEGVEVSKGEHLSLDSEGGAQVTTPKTRYLTTAIAVTLAASSAAPDHDRGLHSDGGGDATGNAANGASGFKLIGTVVGLAARSRVVASGFGVYGAAASIYMHFLARGHDVVYPKDMTMVVGLGTREKNEKEGHGTKAEGAKSGEAEVASAGSAR